MVPNRLDLAKEKGAEFKIKCESCSSSHTVHVDDVNAYENGWLVLGAGLVALLVAVGITWWLWDLGYISTLSGILPVMIYFGTQKSERDKCNVFNGLYYDREQHLKNYRDHLKQSADSQ